MTLTYALALVAAALLDVLLVLAFGWLLLQVIRLALPARPHGARRETAAVRDGRPRGFRPTAGYYSAEERKP